MFNIERLKPVNRHLLIIPHEEENETKSGVILPDDYQPELNHYVAATVLDVAEDCKKEFDFFRFGKIRKDDGKIIVEKSMIKKIVLKEKTHFLILENYVLGIYRRADEN
jgi:co-chaperonin GroES (HSP10)